MSLSTVRESSLRARHRESSVRATLSDLQLGRTLRVRACGDADSLLPRLHAALLAAAGARWAAAPGVLPPGDVDIPLLPNTAAVAAVVHEFLMHPREAVGEAAAAPSPASPELSARDERSELSWGATPFAAFGLPRGSHDATGTTENWLLPAPGFRGMPGFDASRLASAAAAPTARMAQYKVQLSDEQPLPDEANTQACAEVGSLVVIGALRGRSLLGGETVEFVPEVLGRVTRQGIVLAPEGTVLRAGRESLVASLAQGLGPVAAVDPRICLRRGTKLSVVCTSRRLARTHSVPVTLSSCEEVR